MENNLNKILESIKDGDTDLNADMETFGNSPWGCSNAPCSVWAWNEELDQVLIGSCADDLEVISYKKALELFPKASTKLTKISSPYTGIVKLILQLVEKAEDMNCLKCSEIKCSVTDKDISNFLSAIFKGENPELEIAKEIVDNNCDYNHCTYAHSEPGGCYEHWHKENFCNLRATQLPGDRVLLEIIGENVMEEFFIANK